MTAPRRHSLHSHAKRSMKQGLEPNVAGRIVVNMTPETVSAVRRPGLVVHGAGTVAGRIGGRTCRARRDRAGDLADRRKRRGQMDVATRCSCFLHPGQSAARLRVFAEHAITARRRADCEYAMETYSPSSWAAAAVPERGPSTVP